MAGKRPSLAESMRQAAQVEPPPPRPTPIAIVATIPDSDPVPSVTAAADPRPAGFYAATRAGKKKVTAALDPAVHKRLKGLAVAQDTTTEALLLEAIADLFKKHG